jgi:signal transduction histidine kinase
MPLKLMDLVSTELLERMRRLFEELTGVPIVFTDADGRALTAVEEPLRFCGALVNTDGDQPLCLRRKQWNVPEQAVEQALRAEQTGDRPMHHRCRGGFRDTALPIIVEGETVGYAVFARSLPQEPDLDKFRRLAVEGGMSPETGEAVAQCALVMPPERITAVAEYLHLIAGLVANSAHDSLRARHILELEQARDALVHMIVHDLRTPLTSIIGSLMTLESADYDAELVREFVPASLDSANTLLEMVNTLLDINKMESGQMTLDRKPVDFAAVAEAAVSQVQGILRERGHELVTTLDPACKPINADEEKLRRTVVNLLGNAIKFTPDGGRITLASGCDDTGLTFSVTDTGPGIAPEYHEKIFDKFGQVESRQAKKFASTGLGLTFCKMVAEAHGGRIWVDSELGKGSTFSVFLPAAGPPPTS